MSITLPDAPAIEDWRPLAACVGSDPEMWFDPERTADAAAICAACPARRPCLDYAAAVDARDGVFGGMTGAEREAAGLLVTHGTREAYRLHVSLGEPLCGACVRAGTTEADDREHGTNATYKWHRRHGLEPCEPCRRARASYVRGRPRRAARPSPH